MRHKNKFTRRAFFAGAASSLAAPALGQIKGAFEEIGPNADPNDLIDKVWDPKVGAFITVRELIDQLEQSPIILIGERHGFAPHQDREAFILQALADRGRYPTLALEMLEPAQEPVINAYRARNPEYARGLGIALDWANSGWSDWSFYEPVFDVAFAAKLPIVGADLPLAEQQEIEFGSGGPNFSIDPEKQQSWQQSLQKTYCELKTAAEIERLAILQVQRDANFARTVSAHSDTVLICGIAHTRTDRGVPALLTETRISTVNFSTDKTLGQSAFYWITPNAGVESQSNC